MKTVTQIKSDSRRILSKHYIGGLGVAAMFSAICWALIGVVAIPVSIGAARGFVDFVLSWHKIGFRITVPYTPQAFTDFVANMMCSVTFAVIAIILIALLIAGLFSFHLRSCLNKNCKIGEFFSPFYRGFTKPVRMLLLMEFKTTLWGLIGEIPAAILIHYAHSTFYTDMRLSVVLNILGVIFTVLGAFLALRAMLCHSMAFFVLAEDENIGVWRAIHRAEKLMRGNILRLISLNISFFGWYVLGILSFGVVFLFLQPYPLTANAVFYCDISGKKLYFEQSDEPTPPVSDDESESEPALPEMPQETELPAEAELAEEASDSDIYREE